MLRGIFIVGITAFFASPAAAQPEPSQEELIEAGLGHREAGRDAEALAVFEECVRRWPDSGQAVGQMGLAEMALDRLGSAEQHLREALGHADDPWVQRHRSTLEAAVAEIGSRVGTIEVPMAGVRVTLSAHGETLTREGPAVFRVAPGAHSVRIEGVGFVPSISLVSVATGQRVVHNPLRDTTSTEAPVPSLSITGTQPEPVEDPDRYLVRSIRLDVFAGVLATGALGTGIGAIVTRPQSDPFLPDPFFDDPRSTTNKVLIGTSVGLATTAVVLFIAARVARMKHRREERLYDF